MAAGALELSAAVQLCRARGAAMQDAVPAGEGGMAAVMGMDAAGVETLCADAAQGDVLSPANFNSPGQIVIAGHARAVERARELAGARGGKLTVLKVSAPFHCALMRPAAERLAAGARARAASHRSRSPSSPTSTPSPTRIRPASRICSPGRSTGRCSG